MNLPFARMKEEISVIFEIEISSPFNKDILKPLQVFTVHTPCRNAKNVSRKAVESYSDLRPIADKLHISGGAVDLLIGTDFVYAFGNILTASEILKNLLQRGTVFVGKSWVK